MTSNIVKLCTAALAGSLLGIAYERLPPSSQWPSVLQTATAASSIISRRGNNLDDGDDVMKTYVDKVDPVKSAENLKHSARRLRAPSWVIEHLTPEKLNVQQGDRRQAKFHEDQAIHEYFRAKDRDYQKSGYDRGHMAAAGNQKLGQQAVNQTFALSNVTPQIQEFNRGAWERLERYVRFRAKRSKNLYVVTGPLYLPMQARDGNLYVTYRVLGNNHVSVPTHFFKVFLYETTEGKYLLEAFLMPNDEKMDKRIKLDDYRVGIDRLDIIERASGVIFFDQLPRNSLEAPTSLPANFDENYTYDQRKQKLIN